MTESPKYYFDIDGTLLKKGEKTINDSVANGLSLLAEKGLGNATTRGFIRASEAMRGIPTLPYIVENGGSVYSTEGQLLEMSPMSPEEKIAVGGVLREHGEVIKLAAFYPKDSQSDHRVMLYTNTQERLETYLAALPELIRQATLNPEEFAELLEKYPTAMVEIQPEQPEQPVSFPEGLNVSTDGILYVNAVGINKGHTLHRLCEEKNIDLANLVVAGDQATDFSMFRIPGVTSIAVGNSNLQATHHVESPEKLVELIQNL